MKAAIGAGQVASFDSDGVRGANEGEDELDIELSDAESDEAYEPAWKSRYRRQKAKREANANSAEVFDSRKASESVCASLALWISSDYASTGWRRLRPHVEGLG